MSTDTQRQAYQDLQENVSGRRAEVLREITNSKGLGLWEISEKLGWPINSVSGRVTELVKLGHVFDSGLRGLNPHSGKRVILWVCRAAAGAIPIAADSQMQLSGFEPVTPGPMWRH